jgi:hypothetical protein
VQTLTLRSESGLNGQILEEATGGGRLRTLGWSVFGGGKRSVASGKAFYNDVYSRGVLCVKVASIPYITF